MDELLDSELDEIDGRARSATQGPWFVRFLDDDFASSLVAVSTSPDTRKGERWPAFDHTEMVAETLIQAPHRYIDIADPKWDENATFIAAARTDVPRLVSEVRRLRQELADFIMADSSDRMP
jgi:hypothetical protein